MSLECAKGDVQKAPYRALDFVRALPPKGQALYKDIQHGKIVGLNYRIDAVPLVRGTVRYSAYRIEVEGWEYSISNESREYPVLSLCLFERNGESLSFDEIVAEIRIYDTAISKTKRTAHRSISAASYLMRAIESGIVPDVSQVLRNYGLHPGQSEQAQSAYDSTSCYTSSFSDACDCAFVTCKR